MFFACPSCDKRYDLSKVSLPEAGRKVRCAACGTDWVAKPADALASLNAAKPKPLKAPVAEAEEDVSADDAMMDAWGVVDEDEETGDAAGNEENDQSGIDALFDTPNAGADDGEDNDQDSIDAMFGGAEEETNDQNGIDALFGNDDAADGGWDVAEEDEAAAKTQGNVTDFEPIEEAAFEELSMGKDGAVVNEADAKGKKPETLRDAESMARRAAHRAKIKASEKKPMSFGRLVSIAASIATLVCLVQLRDHVVRLAPVLAPVYQAAGLNVNLVGFDFAGVHFSRTVENGIEVLSIKGRIRNVSKDSLPLPGVRFSLLDGTSTPLFQWSKQFDTVFIMPGEDYKFESRLTSPPANATDIVLRFAKPKMMQTSSLN